MRSRIYAYCVIALAAAIAAAVVPQSQPPVLGLALLLGALTVLSEWVALPTHFGGTVSLSFALVYSSVLLGGLATGAVTALFSAVTANDIARKKPVHRILFNAAQLQLSVYTCGVVLMLGGEGPVAVSPAAIESWLPWALIAAAAFAIVNWGLVGVAISIEHGVAIVEVWRKEFGAHTVSLAAMTLLGLVLTQLVAVAGPLALFLLVVPFVVARQTLQVYQQLARALRDTVRGLVQVLEAKDPYTRGHSERVAVYAREIAEEIGLVPVELQNVELAALLHDIGKVGIAAATLGKAGRLTVDEFGEIQLHPVTGSSILSDIEFLNEIAPLIEAHHERLDGSGYPHGLRGEALPLQARILAVADCFDAMTSDRAYRQALTYDIARQELLRSADEKLDRACIEALFRRVTPERAAALIEGGAAWGE